MDPIAHVEGNGDARPSVDPLQRVVQVSLAIYLMPVVAVVCAIGGVSIAIGAVGQLMSRFGGNKHRPIWPGPHAVATPARGTTQRAQERRRVRVGG